MLALKLNLFSRRTPRYRRRVFGAAALSTAAFAVVYNGVAACEDNQSALKSEGAGDGLLHYYKRWKHSTVGMYENRLRVYSHPLKVFQYFSTVHKGDQAYMTVQDFIRSLTPYQGILGETDETDAGQASMQKVSSAVEFFKLADVDGDGLISFPEYMFFLTLLEVPKRMWTTAFELVDEDGSRSLCHTEFASLFEKLSSSMSVYHRLGASEGKLARAGVEQCTGLMNFFFGPKRDGQLRLTDFQRFMEELHRQVLKLEFFQYRVWQQAKGVECTISLHDFARALVSYTPSSHLAVYTKRIQNLPHYSERVSFREFEQFDASMKGSISEFEQACKLMSYLDKGVTASQLQRVLLIITGIKVSDQMADMLTSVFEYNGTRTLDSVAFSKTIKNRLSRNIGAASQDGGLFEFLAKTRECILR